MSSEHSVMAYAELHCLSNFSFLRGASHPEELVLQASKLGYRALALTDECSLAGVVRAYAAIREHQLAIQLIVGSEFRLDDGQLVVLLAPSRKAYAELSALITLARRRCGKGQYQIFMEDLRQQQSVLACWRPSQEEQKDAEFAEQLCQYFPKRAWLLYERLLDAQENAANTKPSAYLQTLSERFHLPVVAAGNIHMHVPERQPLQDVLTAIRLNTSVQKAGLALHANAERVLRPLKKLRKLYPQACLEESLRIAARCDFDLGTLRYEYPRELVPEGLNPARYLRQLVEQGVEKRFPNGVSLSIQRTIRRELELISEQGYEYFFLTTYDIVQFAKKKGILYQGRGSAANSIVCYCLEITSVDPQQIDVLFERFISKERNEPPDIDVDFEHQRREEVFQYIYQKYGRERAALAATVISFKFKSALRSVGKALGIAESRLDFYIKNVNRRDRELGWRAQLEELGLDPSVPLTGHLYRLTEEIIGFPRHLSQHVGGFIISAGPLSELVPVENAAMAERTVIQWDKDDLESLGLLKVDVLALGMLSAIRRSFDLIRWHYGRTLSIADITRMGDDPAVYADLQAADSIGIFQVESRAQMSMLPRLKPRCYYDLVIQIAIVRPGPIQGDMVHPYLRRREGLEEVDYPSKEVKAVLERTLGVPIFQEQVIKLAMVAAGFSGGEADQLRRAMASWKRSGQLQAFRHKLVDGMLARGYESEFAERVFQQICGFGEYGFPESHSASFAVLAYVSAWLKHYYPLAFYCGLMNSLPMGFYSPSQLIQDAQRHGLKVLPVCINASMDTHCLEGLVRNSAGNGVENSAGNSVEKRVGEGIKQLDARLHRQALRLGFRQVRGLSKQGIERLLSHRPKEGFKSIAEVKSSGLDQGDLEALASANAFAVFSGHRYQARWAMLEEHSPLFATADHVAEEKAVFAAPHAWESLREDYATLGLSLDLHPIRLLREQGLLGAKHVLAKDLKQRAHQSWVKVAGAVTGKQSPGSAQGVTFFTLEDETGNINVVVWQATARAQKSAFLTAKLLEVTGFLEREGEVVHVIAGRLRDISHLMGALDVRSRDFH